MEISPALRRQLAGYTWRRDTRGMSPATVVRLDKPGETLYMKTSPPTYTGTTYDVHREAQATRWLAGWAHVPRVLHYEETGGWHTMVMTALPGEPIDAFLERGEVEAAVGHYARAVRLLHSIPVRECPLYAGVSLRLRELDLLLQRGMASTEDWEPDTPFATAEELAAWLHSHAPPEEPAVSHGDISNMMVYRGEPYFFDLGRCGVADRYGDPTFVLRELRGTPHPAHWAEEFLRQVGLPANEEKLRYFLLLDELF